jgi:hypothetical protein
MASVPSALTMEHCVRPSKISRSHTENPIPIGDGHATAPEEPRSGSSPTRRASRSIWCAVEGPGLEGIRSRAAVAVRARTGRS